MSARIEYEQIAGKPLRVRLDGKIVGEIRKMGPNWRYVAKGGAEGEMFATIAEVKRSLEAE